MRAMVRDDIIDLETFVLARFKYDEYLRKIHDAGGYCFLIQFEEHWKEYGGKYLAEKMEVAGLLKTKLYSNTHKFCYLSAAALKYLILGDSKKDYSGIPKNKISVKNLTDIPSEKQLFTSVLKFSSIANRPTYRKSIGKIGMMELIEDQFTNMAKTVLGNVSEEKIKEYKKLHLSKAHKKYQDLYDISKIIVFPYSSSKDGKHIFQMMILDYGKTRTPASYFRIYQEFEKLLPQEMQVSTLDVIIISYAENRAAALLKQFDEAQKERQKALVGLEKATSQKPEWVKRLKNVTEKIPEFKARISPKNPYYLTRVKAKRVSTNVIKHKDEKALEKLKHVLKNTGIAPKG